LRLGLSFVFEYSLVDCAIKKGPDIARGIAQSAINAFERGIPAEEALTMLAHEIGVPLQDTISLVSKSSSTSEIIGSGITKVAKQTIATGSPAVRAAQEVSSTEQAATRLELTERTAEIAGRQGKLISLAEYDTSLGNLKKLEEAVNMFKNNPSAIAKDGPLTKLLECGKASESAGNLATARGAAYELEKAYDLAKAGEEIVEFGKKIHGTHSRREFDIITKTKLIECKNIDWSRYIGEAAQDMKGRIGEQLKIANEIEKPFEFHSKNKVPEVWKKWFEKKCIKLIEG